jgi:hypothetical protein
MTAQINLKMLAESLHIQLDQLNMMMKFGQVALNHQNDGFIWNFVLELNKNCPKKFLKNLKSTILVLPPDDKCEKYRVFLECELDVLTSRCCLDYMGNDEYMKNKYSTTE